MSKTKRWHRISPSRLPIWFLLWIDRWKNINPYYFRHEDKEVRIELHRKIRHANRIGIKKFQDLDEIEIEPHEKTNGWLTH